MISLVSGSVAVAVEPITELIITLSRLTLCAGVTRRAPLTDELTLTSRPEHLIRGSPGADGTIEVQVDYWEHLGGVSYAYGALANEQRIILEQRLDRSTAGLQSLTLAIDPSRAFLFDAEGKRLRPKRSQAGTAFRP